MALTDWAELATITMEVNRLQKSTAAGQSRRRFQAAASNFG